MRFAFEFDAQPWGSVYGAPIEEIMFRAVAGSVPAARRHVWITCGDLILDAGPADDAVIAARARRTLSSTPALWTTVEGDRLAAVTIAGRVHVVLLNGLTLQDATAVDGGIRRIDPFESYLGALEVNLGIDLHWAVFDQSLVNRYRLIGDELRLLHGGEEERDEGQQRQWERAQIFSSVGFEDIGVKGSIFDPYDTRERARTLAGLEERLGAEFATMTNEVLLRMGALDPRLFDTLYAAFAAFDRATTSEQLAHVALSCRRLIEQLADALNPPTGTSGGVRKMGQAEYRNRLWAYVEARIAGAGQNAVLATLDDVGHRIDKLDKLANSGLHRPEASPTEVQRLLVGLVALMYDLLTLAPPPTRAPERPYRRHFRSIITEWLGGGDHPGDD